MGYGSQVGYGYGSQVGIIDFRFPEIKADLFWSIVR